jgi:hypothetical protein
VGLFADRGWRDDTGAALSVVRAVEAADGVSLRELEQVPSEFLERNRLKRADVGSAIESRVRGWTMAPLSPRSPAEKVGARQVRILLASAGPDSEAPLRLDRELRLIRDQLELGPFAKQFALDVRPAAVYTELPRYILQASPAAIHLSGHGSSEGLTLEDEEGNARLVTTAALESLFGQPAIRRSLRVVVLNSCLSRPQAEAIAKYVPAVVGNRSSISDQAATEFARGFYMALAQGLTVREAFGFGKTAISLAGLDEDDLPILVEASGHDNEGVRLFE